MVVSEQKRRVEELADWIDANVIAEALLDELLENNIEPSVENGKKLWLDILEYQLPDAIQSAINHIF